MKSIRQKLVIYTLILVVLPFLISTIANSIYMKQSYEKELEKNNNMLANSIADQVAAFIQEGYALTEQIAIDDEVRSFNPEQQKKVLMNYYDRHTYFDLLYVQGVDGMQTARTTGELGDRSNRWWFIKAMEELNSFVSKSYYTLATNTPVTTIAFPMYDGSNNVIGVMAADIKLTELQNRVQKYSEGSRYAFVIDGEGVVVAHPDTIQVSELYNYRTMKKTVLKMDASGAVVLDQDGNQVLEEQEIVVPETLMEMAEKALKGESGYEFYKDKDGVEVVSAYKSITLPGVSDNWAVITVENKADAMAFISDSQFFNIIIAIVSIILAAVLITIVASRIAGPIKKSANYLDIIAEGNFLIDVDKSMMSRKDEIGIIATGIETMKESLKSLAMEITLEADSILHKVNVVSTDMNHLSDNLEGISATTEELSANTEETAAATEEMTATSQEIARAAQTIAESSGKGAMAARDISLRAEDTKEKTDLSIQKATAMMMETEGRLKDAIERSKVVEQINVLSASIMDITEQTNLLALNASIEAARAGEAGKGFSIVAKEIGKLADQSKSAVKQITEVTSEVVEAVENLSNSADILLTFVSTDVASDYENMLGVAKKYNEDAKFVDDLVTEFSATSEELLASIENMTQAIDGVAIAANESANGTTEIANMVSEANMDSNNIMDKVKETKVSSDSLKNEVSKFKF
mgnify:FL=1